MHITNKNLNEYLSSTYNTQSLQKENEIIGFKPLLQKDYGGSNDCTLTSITAIINHITEYKNNVAFIYEHVESIAQKNFYEVDGCGTMLFAIRTIFNDSVKKYSKKTSCVKYNKGHGWDFNFIKKEIDEGNLILLSINSDGLDYYKNHSIIIVGYKEYNDAKILKIYDNWSKEPSYLDYEKISFSSSAHCLCSKSYPILDWLWKILVLLFGKK